MKIIWNSQGQAFREVTTREEIPPFTAKESIRLRHFKTGATDRRTNRGCCSQNGDYLDGYYSPTSACPDFITAGQFAAFYPLITTLH